MNAKSEWHDKKNEDSPTSSSIRNRIQPLSNLLKKRGVHSVTHMSSAGFKYTGDGDTCICNDCGLEISNWTSDMNPFIIHSKKKPDCPFVCSTIPSSSSTIRTRDASTLDEQENPAKRQKFDSMYLKFELDTLFEVKMLQQARKRTFSHWSLRTIPSIAQMIEAGFFHCNVGDRVICIYCNLICQQWTPHTDDPCEVHKTLSPNCIYVKSKLMHPAVSSVIVNNENSASVASASQLPTSNNLDPVQSNEIVFTAACNPAYTEIPKRCASYATWPNENLPSVDDFVRAGFFYTGTNTTVTCFYCNGSLQNWGPNDNPMIEHARWFPHCAYAKQLCGDELYRKIQESKRAQQERAKANELRENKGANIMTNTNPATNSRLILIPDESTLSRLVAARLDLPISQRLLDQNFKVSIIKRCWEDQLRLKHMEFLSECDLHIACLILQKQIEHIDGKKENIVIPSTKMKQIREQNAGLREQTTNKSQAVPTPTDTEITTSSQSPIDSSNQDEINVIKPTTSPSNDQNQSTSTAPSNPCVLCLAEEKRLACIPCGHLATCVPCGHSLRLCPICRREIEAFVRIYIK